jgi:antitoxin ParD1/3/4
MPTMNVSLSDEFVEFVESEIASGEYGTASEVVRDALRVLKRERAARDEKLAVLRRELAIGLEQAQSGRFSEKSVADIAESLRTRNKRRK